MVPALAPPPLPDVVTLPEPVRSQVLRQEGVASVAQLERAGISRRTAARRVASGRWQRLYRGVLVLQSGAVSWRQQAHATLVAAGDGAALSHASAGYVLGLVRVPRGAVVVSVPVARSVRPQPGMVVHRRRTMPHASGRLRTVDVVETVLDLLGEAADDDQAVAVLAAAAQIGVSRTALLRRAQERRWLAHRELLRSVLTDPTLGIESPLEHRYVRDVERAHRLPRTVGQVRQRVDGGWIRADRVHGGAGVRIELDGRLAHPGGTTDRDVWRDNAVLLEHDDLTLRYRWSHVAGRPCDVARQVGHALTRTGRPTSPTRCPRCP
ncbi:type IV toxin-antitoxin system AbiEi family antitoxin domain-containing protein [Cellulomonas wangsupingiae]|uniref:Type IV toxin-antitoxin system AbiEi family antitoxin domain-containing protein n=1 Tax=Cellulomonas wangsupingiae TaxID=2968085 RepID=A0ABY5KAN8_9CELL|nr:type IV toxin-antitoxin system AbiEi family antitoxin domain-containing protein [Cellulomonas wangsupingiae]MCC2334486.1 type IV toxin-antitoxin system AbiEi family antitoxin domain-containing protein [Cellulomonas wangsupingiae]UUI66145.1 type IV toxin-antitoxin system AbiEi family antitoxin domain-containing protein [Cellulomonas wangsupingiae]